jgi:hypothetical protein
LGLAFFGLTSSDLEKVGEIKLSIYKQIHQICFHGKGGYSWPVVYNMPIYLRRFVFSEIKQFYEEEQKANSKQTSPNQNKQIVPGPARNSTPKQPTRSSNNNTVKVPIKVQYK